MQNVLIEKPYQFVPPMRVGWPQKWYLKLGLHLPTIRGQGIVQHECRHLDRLRQSIDAGHGILITPNHPRTADAMAMCFLARETPCNFYAMASWHLFNQGWLSKFVIRMMGAFSVNREGLDRQAIDEAIKILQTGERPLILFPEGTTSRTNDHLMSLMEGPAFIARTAAKRRAKQDGGKVVVHPVSIRYLFDGDIQAACDKVLTDIEKKLTWRPEPNMPLTDRIIRVGNALLALKEMQYAAPVDSQTSLRGRQDNFVDHLLNPLEEEWLGGGQDGGVAQRIKSLRMKIFPDMSRNELPEDECKRRWRQLEDTYLAQQIDCYPENYVGKFPSVDRLLETVEKFEEDLTDTARKHGNLKVILNVDEAIEVSPRREKGATADPLMVAIRDRLETGIAETQSMCQMYQP